MCTCTSHRQYVSHVTGFFSVRTVPRWETLMWLTFLRVPYRIVNKFLMLLTFGWVPCLMVNTFLMWLTFLCPCTTLTLSLPKNVCYRTRSHPERVPHEGGAKSLIWFWLNCCSVFVVHPRAAVLEGVRGYVTVTHKGELPPLPHCGQDSTLTH